MRPIRSFKVDSLDVEVYDDDTSLGQAAAAFVAMELASVVEKIGFGNLVLATGASQFAFLEALKRGRIRRLAGRHQGRGGMVSKTGTRLGGGAV